MVKVIVELPDFKSIALDYLAFKNWVGIFSLFFPLFLTTGNRNWTSGSKEKFTTHEFNKQMHHSDMIKQETEWLWRENMLG